MARKFRLLMMMFLMVAQSMLIAQAADNETLFMKGFEAYKSGLFEQAVNIFSGISVDSVADDFAVAARFYSIISLINIRDFIGAENASEKFLLENGNSEYIQEVQYQRGRISLLRGDYSEAIERFSAFMADHQNSTTYPLALLWYGESHYLMGKLREAFEIFTEVLINFPDFNRRDIVEWRLEVLGLESREAMYKRRLAHSETLRLQLTRDDENVEKYREQKFERSYIYMKKLRNLYALTPLVIDETKEPLVTIEPVVDTPAEETDIDKYAMMEMELRRVNKLYDLLAAKNSVYKILIQKLEQYIKESDK